ncbi:hypothetical protein Droror1_Dr00019619 [Drosera rotundifolia]
MGRRNRNPKSNPNPNQNKQEQLLETLGDFTTKENWDKFFTIRGNDSSFEWYAEWPQLRDPLLSFLPPPPTRGEVQILVPGCGNSRMSKELYDAGFRRITNVGTKWIEKFLTNTRDRRISLSKSPDLTRQVGILFPRWVENFISNNFRRPDMNRERPRPSGRSWLGARSPRNFTISEFYEEAYLVAQGFG